jgi:hypothetical protein
VAYGAYHRAGQLGETGHPLLFVVINTDTRKSFILNIEYYKIIYFKY